MLYINIYTDKNIYKQTKKQETKGKKERVSKSCHQYQNVIVLAILERLEFKTFSCRPTMVRDNTFQCSMAPPL